MLVHFFASSTSVRHVPTIRLADSGRRSSLAQVSICAAWCFGPAKHCLHRRKFQTSNSNLKKIIRKMHLFNKHFFPIVASVDALSEKDRRRRQRRWRLLNSSALSSGTSSTWVTTNVTNTVSRSKSKKYRPKSIQNHSEMSKWSIAVFSFIDIFGLGLHVLKGQSATVAQLALNSWLGADFGVTGTVQEIWWNL